MSVKSKLSIALTLVALGIGPAAYAQSDIGQQATGTRSTWGTGQGALYYDANGGLHYGVTDPNAVAATQVARRHRARGTDAFAQAPRAPRRGGIYNSVGRSMLPLSSLNYQPDLRSH